MQSSRALDHHGYKGYQPCTRLTEPKLKSLFSELKIHDKEELLWKKLKTEGKDKEGLKEAEMRKKLIGIMSSYGLLEHFEDIQDPKQLKQHKAFNGASDKHINKSLFKDKKLNKLWDKAETGGFTGQFEETIQTSFIFPNMSEELQALKEEFTHHQEKIDQYHSLLDQVESKSDDKEANSVDDALDRFNTIQEMEEPGKDYLHKANLLRAYFVLIFTYAAETSTVGVRETRKVEVMGMRFVRSMLAVTRRNKIRNKLSEKELGYRDRHRDIRDGYDRLHRIAAKGPNSKEFIEPKVQGLWMIAVNADFTAEELESLRVELMHYENRLLKLRHMHAEAELGFDRRSGKESMVGKTEGLQMMEDNIKKQARKVEKLHFDLETKIMQRHIEL
uniref:Alpha-2-macroglobulin receptor-associated protein n=1 Tax=Timema monikensis TaxID=170555 RepID=A0A7R9E3V8_9NEOP|nr:unnamed protein product [Timema monikensis]